MAAYNTATHFSHFSFSGLRLFGVLEAIFASLSGTGPVSMVMMHSWFIGFKEHFGDIAC